MWFTFLVAVSIASSEGIYVGGNHMHSKYKLQFLFHNESIIQKNKKNIEHT